MKANELQIGDWIIADGKPHKVSTLRKYPENHTIGCIGKYGEFFDNTDKIIPIPLTEEILEANGFFEYNPFKTINYKMYAFPEQCNIKKERGFGIEIGNGAFYITDHCLMPIKYVHELQHALKQCGLSEFANNFKIE